MCHWYGWLFFYLFNLYFLAIINCSIRSYFLSINGLWNEPINDCANMSAALSENERIRITSYCYGRTNVFMSQVPYLDQTKLFSLILKMEIEFISLPIMHRRSITPITNTCAVLVLLISTKIWIQNSKEFDNHENEYQTSEILLIMLLRKTFLWCMFYIVL